jgi:hypothetical protein
VKRRILRLGLVLISGIGLLAGCESLDHHKRPRSQDDSISEEEKEASGFWKGSRPSGAMSSEGRSIERDLGIGLQ